MRYNILQYILLFFCFFSTFLKVSAQQTVPPYKDELVRVETKLKEGNFQGAIDILDKITIEYPKASDVYYAKALLFGQVGNLDLALFNAEEAYKYDAQRTYLVYMIDLNKSKKDWAKVSELLQKASAQFPDEGLFGRDLILTLGFTNRFDEAVKVYNEEKERKGLSDTLDVTMADVLFYAGKTDEGIALLLPWSHKSTLSGVYDRLAFGYMKNNKVKSAISVLETGVEKSFDPVLYLDLGDSYRINGKSKLAYDAFKKGFSSNKVDFGQKYEVMLDLLKPEEKTMTKDQIQNLVNELVIVHPRIAESHMLKGEVLWKNGNNAEARSMFLTAVGLAPNQIDAWRMLINLDLVMGKVDDAINHSKEALSINTNNPALLYFAGISYLSKDDNTSARQMLETALNNSTNENSYLQSIIYGSLGDLYHKLNMDAASDVAYVEAIRLDSTNAAAMNNLAYYLSERKKDLDKAASYSLRSIELEPEIANYQDTYAWILFQQGNYAEALKWIEKAIKGSSVISPVLAEHYGDILSQLGRTKDALKQWQKALTYSELSEKDKAKIEQKIKERKYVD